MEQQLVALNQIFTAVSMGKTSSEIQAGTLFI
jgi:hypothetical protein